MAWSSSGLCARWTRTAPKTSQAGCKVTLSNASWNGVSSSSKSAMSNKHPSVHTAVWSSNKHRLCSKYAGPSQGASNARTWPTALTRPSRAFWRCSRCSQSSRDFVSSILYWLSHKAHCHTKVFSGSRAVRRHQSRSAPTTLRTRYSQHHDSITVDRPTWRSPSASTKLQCMSPSRGHKRSRPLPSGPQSRHRILVYSGFAPGPKVLSISARKSLAR
mmetsp:Transcript_81611/g.227277  ORF Transcript_81611/g.227277 Transcript_81611/m.227277 type:complete len:217 (+) Transcript_81611:2181-2831(+)